MRYRTTINGQVFAFEDLKQVMAVASPARSGDYLAEIGAATAQHRMAARYVLADTPLQQFLTEALIPYESDNITRLIIDTHDAAAFAPVSHLTVGDFRNWLLSTRATTEALTALAPGLTPEMVAAVSKLMRNQDLVSVAKKCSVVTRFRNTVGLPGHLSVRLQPNHPTDDLRGVAASTLDGLLMGAGDAVIGLNPASDSMPVLGNLLHMLDEVIQRFEIPTQSCVLTHVTNTLELAEAGAPVDLVFQSIAGTEKANLSFGVTPELLDEA
ncbi:MAG: ethanolamine ammonia lyase large subunit, partial [Variovorax sp.]